MSMKKALQTYAGLYLFWCTVVFALGVVGFNWEPTLITLPVPMGIGVIPFILHLVVV